MKDNDDLDEALSCVFEEFLSGSKPNTDVAKVLVKLLLEAGANPNGRKPRLRSTTPLHIAAAGDHVEFGAMLIQAGADPNAMAPGEFTPLGVLLTKYVGVSAKGMTESKCWPFVRILLDAGLVMSSREGRRALAAAASQGNSEWIQILLKAGADPNALGEVAKTWHHPDEPNYLTPLELAVKGGNPECVRLLLAAGADTGARNKRGETALHCAVSRGESECVRALLEAGSDIEAKNEFGATPLASAVSVLVSERGRFNPDVIRILIDAGSDVNAARESGWTVLHSAVECNNVAAIGMLLDAGAEVSTADQRGTALRLAVERGKADCVQALLDGGVTPNERGTLRRTLVHIAAIEGQVDIVGMLVAAGAKVELKDRNGLTPYEHVQELIKKTAPRAARQLESAMELLPKLEAISALLQHGILEKPGKPTAKGKGGGATRSGPSL